jgi:D-alanyl-D-alanine dipeptidase
MCFKIKFLLGWVLIPQFLAAQWASGFTVLNTQLPEVEVELRYATSNNFLGRPVIGYYDSVAIGSEALANQLLKVQSQLKVLNLGLKIYDAYRPQSAVDDFLMWSKIPNDTLAKAQYYPDHPKNELFDLGFIALKSGHSRGSTVDVSIVYLDEKKKGVELDMGGSWDFFGTLSHYAYPKLSTKQKENRKLLRTVMIQNGFKPYDKEWWHFTLIEEPFPDTYFNFPIALP